MKLVIDIGNTNIKFALFNNGIIKQLKIISTKYYKQIPNFKNVNQCVIGSVVPSLNKLIKTNVDKKYRIDSKIINANDFDKLFNLSSFNKKEIGLDILAFALLIKNYFHKGIGICFGTATFGVVIDNKTIHGVVITPSFMDSLESMYKKTALIKKNEINKISLGLGRNTISALSCGIAHNVNGFINSLISYCDKHYHINQVCVSGGNTNWLKLNKKIQHVEHAVLHGYDLVTS